MEKKSKIYLFVFLLLTILILVPISRYLSDFESFSSEKSENVHSSAQRTITKQWIKNPTFEAPIEPIWYWENGTEGDNSDMDATTSIGQANYEVLGEMQTFTVVSGTVNNSANSQGWEQFNKAGFLLPDTAEIRSYGCFVYHYWYDDPNQFPSVQWRNNISLPIDMSDYIITSVSLEVIVNATVSNDVDTPNDGAYWENFAIGDSVTFYTQISDLGFNPPKYTVALNKTKYLGQNSPAILTLTDSSLETVNDLDLITALNSAFEKDPDHSNFTLTLGIDIYSEDNLGASDPDTFNELIIKSCNLTFTVKKKIDQSTTLSWNQIGNQLSGGNIQIRDAMFNFNYSIDKSWPATAPLSEINFYINDRKFEEGSIKISSATSTSQEAKPGGFNVTTFILKDINITASIETFIKDTFELNESITISIDDVFLNITYIETFTDYPTELTLFLNGDDKTSDPVIQIPIDVILNITVKYKDSLTSSHIPNATVQLDGIVSGPLPENKTYEQYSIFINSSQLGIGSRIISVEAQKTNYESQLTQIFVEVYERGTVLSLYINSDPKADSETMQIEVDEVINISVFFKDFITDNHLSGATIELLGFGFLEENINYYNITINSNALNLRTNILTIFAQLNNYQTQTIKFFIYVIQRSTQLQILLNGGDETSDPVIDVPIGRMINVSIRYKDNSTGSYINGGTLQLIGEGLSIPLIENTTLNQYSTILNSTELQLGAKLFSIVAQATDYNINTVNIRINVNRIRTNISTVSGETNIYLEPEESYTLMIHLNDTDYGGLIRNATVTYRWAHGQGELRDLDNDGIYEVYFEKIPGGTYIMTITAYAGENYEFEDYEIVISVSSLPGLDWKWLVIILGSSALGLVIIIVSYLKHFKYPPLVRKIRKLRKKVSKNKKLKSMPLQNREDIIETNLKSKLEVIEKKSEIKGDIKKNFQNNIKQGGETF
ncbi:MAG: hypothetical protein WBH31_16465 [Promethearchaeia archaeon]